ncbi:hypothetical protein BC835DRAFT_1311376 [Cytidiella melzeri]|nr:hypothetical protein BC835DRAFT_1311376 [Cytidiella melzeri]
MEALAYVLIDFARGWSPWQELSGAIPEECAAILSLKKHWTAEDLCMGLPQAFLLFLLYTRSLEFSQQLDYSYACLPFRAAHVDMQDPVNPYLNWADFKHLMLDDPGVFDVCNLAFHTMLRSPIKALKESKKHKDVHHTRQRASKAMTSTRVCVFPAAFLMSHAEHQYQD